MHHPKADVHKVLILHDEIFVEFVTVNSKTPPHFASLYI